MSFSIRLLSGILITLLAGCQTVRSLYYWGQYENGLYQSYANPGKSSPDEQILQLLEDITKAAAAGLPVNPGLHAQLGYLYYAKGQLEAAQKEFETEKILFPESTILMDRLLEKSKSGAKQ